MKHTGILSSAILAFLIISACSTGSNGPADRKGPEKDPFPGEVKVEYQEVSEIGYEEGVSRRDPSDIIQVNDTHYIWYTRIPAASNGIETPLYSSGYYGTIWYATSTDGGYSWRERGEALGTGAEGEFDSHAVFTPNILFAGDRYYLFYTAVTTTPGRKVGIFENNSENDYTAIGLAVADSPDGPFLRVKDNPILRVSNDPDLFDSYRIDDAALLVNEGEFHLYYKGRSLAHGIKGPGQTRMGVALSPHPEGPYRKHGPPILDRSHEVLIWNHRDGVAALASISSTLEFAVDGFDFELEKASRKLENRPAAPGLFRPHLTDHAIREIPGWGISMRRKGRDIYLVRFKLKY